MALDLALERHQELDSPLMNIKIYSDSKYAIGCMTVEAHKWQRNGYRTSADYEIKKEDNILSVNSCYAMLNQRIYRLKPVTINACLNWLLSEGICL